MLLLVIWTLSAWPRTFRNWLIYPTNLFPPPEVIFHLRRKTVRTVQCYLCSAILVHYVCFFKSDKINMQERLMEIKWRANILNSSIKLILFKYIFISRQQRAEKTLNVTNTSIENVGISKYFGMTITNQNHIDGKIRNRLKSGNNSYHSVQKRLPSQLLSKDVKIKIYKTILPVLLYECETLSLTLCRRYWGEYLDLRGRK
jgi:hypothetical protein